MTLINCDLGECLTPDPDEVIMPLIDMANIACGGHAGDQLSMEKTVRMAKQYGVKVGAHPSYQDKENFGRISHDIAADKLLASLVKQVSNLQQLCQQYDVEMTYIKPHGALYHDMMHKPEVLEVLCQVIATVDPTVELVVQAGVHQQAMLKKSAQTAISFIYEAFADRGYQANQMIPRSQSGAMLDDAEQIVAQYQLFSQPYQFPIDTICFHSDHPASVVALQFIQGH